MTAAEPRPDPSGRQSEEHHPVRTCVGCRRRDRQSHVMRVVAQQIDGMIVAVLDERRRLSGRGAWLHPDPACMETAIKRKAFSRAFRRSVETARLAVEVQAHLERRGAPTPGTTVLPESGSQPSWKPDENPPMSAQR